MNGGALTSFSGMNSPSLLIELHDKLWLYDLSCSGSDPGGGLGDSRFYK